MNEELHRLAREATLPSDKVTGLSPAGRTKIWRIKEAPEYEIEVTPGLWVLWNKCSDLNEECPLCGGTGSKIVDTCGKNEKGEPLDQDMIKNETGLEKWTPVRIQ